MKEPATAKEPVTAAEVGPIYATWHARCRAYASQGLIPALKPSSPAAVEA